MKYVTTLSVGGRDVTRENQGACEVFVVGWNIWIVVFRVVAFFKKFHSGVKLCILDATQYLPR